MVQSADTSAQFSGKRRTYRHDLDRVVNGDLPSTVGSAKKNLVKLENALEDFLNGMMPIGNAEEITIMKNWIDKSLDYIGDVLKIVDKPDVKALADDLVKTIQGIKKQTKEKVSEMEIPIDESIPKKKRNARIVFWLGVALIWVPIIGLVMAIVGAIMLNRSRKNRVAHENAIENAGGMKAAVASW